MGLLSNEDKTSELGYHKKKNHSQKPIWKTSKIDVVQIYVLSEAIFLYLIEIVCQEKVT